MEEYHAPRKMTINLPELHIVTSKEKGWVRKATDAVLFGPTVRQPLRKQMGVDKLRKGIVKKGRLLRP